VTALSATAAPDHFSYRKYWAERLTPALFLPMLLLGAAASTAAQEQRQIAVTFDDLPVVSAVDQSLAHDQTVTDSLLAAFEAHGVPVIGFVNENKLEREGAQERERIALLERWLDAGHELGNHTYSHIDLHTAPFDEVQRDVVRGEVVTRELTQEAGAPLRYFRHPFLHTGRDAEMRAEFEAFLERQGYKVAPVTIDNSDYLFARAFDYAVAGNDTELATRIATAFLEYMESVVAYYEQQSVALLGREPPQVLLLHANALNARTFDAFATMLERRGYEFVTLEQALEDPAYRSRDEFFGPGGITWLHRWALTQGKRGAFFDGEPVVPEWIEAATAPAPERN
jgi:peptidoglycan/xylan/chitin deacetylase (PgdA/CDA1 family)